MEEAIQEGNILRISKFIESWKILRKFIKGVPAL